MAANKLAMGGLVLLTIFLGLLSVEGMNVVLTNNMNAEVGITCQLEGTIPGDFGSRIVFPGNTYVFQVGDGSTNFAGRRYNCVFAANGKPRTILEVFAATGGAGNAPCNCAGAVCPWSVTANGFSCAGFSHGWGN